MTKVTMTVNGKAVSGEVEGRTLLSSFLREGLGLTGTHVGCDTSQCGACVVHVDGRPVKSCSVFAADVAGAAGEDHRGDGECRWLAGRGPAGVPGPPRPAMRFLHAGHGDVARRRCWPRTRSRPRPRCATIWKATSAAARAITTSSRPCWRRAGRPSRLTSLRNNA